MEYHRLSKKKLYEIIIAQQKKLDSTRLLFLIVVKIYKKNAEFYKKIARSQQPEVRDLDDK